MRVDAWLNRSQKLLQGAGIPSARLDCLVILEEALDMDRTLILAHPETELSPETEVELNKKIAQRAKHMPLAYIRGKCEFYGRTFLIDQNVLVPRPETEAMIDMLKLVVNNDHQITIADIGTGSGAIAVTVKLELPSANVLATDIDSKCIKVASQNAKHLNADVKFFQGDLLAPLPPPNTGLPNVILANLPYVPERYAINQAAEHEPKHAIFGGKDGLDVYRDLWEQISALASKPTLVLTESLPPQHKAMAELAKSAGYKLYRTNDFIQAFKPNWSGRHRA